MKKGLSRTAKIGIFGLSMAVLLYLGINYIKSKKIFSGMHTYYVEYSTAAGIEVSAPVVIKGFKVGTVDNVSFDIKKSTIVVSLSVSNKYPIPDNSRAKVTSTSLLGGSVIEIVLGNSKEDLQNRAHIAAVEEQGMMEALGSEYEKLKQMASGLVDQLSLAMQGINGVLSPENVKNLSGLIANLNGISANLNTLIGSQQSNLNTMLANLNRASKTLGDELTALSPVVTNLDSVSLTLRRDLPLLTANANNAINNLNVTLSKINSPEGTIGKLLNEDELYNNINGAIDALTILLEDVKQNPRRYINVSIFGSGKK
ncbi:ABC transporter-related permease with MCE domain [Mucinivorans hirudinis]|uniref:ABC transporter-related permease with MCE domain n=1 Tax=Mucinivorans hirudinis TaxID=1433126 RepID=A0A060RBB0_9BACT|nr:ABC transporter-related permease with MCE domain [Mucinivorans hirudinis]